jgi:hypothetical protein
MSTRILTETPTSGEFPEFYFGEHFRQTMWVEFVDRENEKWVGCFPCEYPKLLNEILVDNENKSALVISSGIGYLIDIENKKLNYKTDEYSPIESAILTINPNYFIAGTYYCIYIFDNEKLIKEVLASELIDGIYFKRQIGSKAVGDLASMMNQYEYNLDFELDLETFELIINEDSNHKHNETAKTIKVVEKVSETKQNIVKRFINKIRKKK